MQLWVGLGNPGPKYAKNRHNIGYMALDHIADAYGATPWRNKFQASITELTLAGHKTLLMKPETFMNLSGNAVTEVMRFYKLTPQDITIWHDELDLAPGKIRYKMGGGHAGHNGLRSIHQHIGADYARIRLGIGHPGQKDLVAQYVLSDFFKADQTWLTPLLDGIEKGAPSLAAGQSDKFLNAVASASQKRPSAPKTSAPPRDNEKPRKAEPSPPTDTRSALQKLVDKFR